MVLMLIKHQKHLPQSESSALSFLVFLQPALAVPAGQMAECNIFGTSALTSFLKAAAPPISRQHQHILPNLHMGQWVLTSLTGASQVAGTGAVADIAVPALPADAVVLAGVGQALLGRLPGAGGLDAHGPLGLSQPPDVFALAVHKQVSDAAHVAVVQQSCPDLQRRSDILFFIPQKDLDQVLDKPED